MLYLTEPDERYLEGYREAYLLSLQKVNEGRIALHDLMFSDPDGADIIKSLLDARDRSKLKPGYVPSYNFFAVDGEAFIGRVNIRTALTPALLQYGGNIGYAINPKYWRMGCGTEALRLALEKARELIQTDEVLITCDDSNTGSCRVIEKNGGVLENKVVNTDSGETFLTRRYRIRL